MAIPCDLRVESLADHPELFEQVGLLRWKQWAYGARDPAPFIEVTAKEAGRSGQLPMTLVAIDVAGGAVGAVGLDRVDDELNVAERAGRTPWIVGMVVRAENRRRGWAVSCWRACRMSPRHLATFGIPDAHEQRAGTHPRSRTDLNGSGCPHMELHQKAVAALRSGHQAGMSSCTTSRPTPAALPRRPSPRSPGRPGRQATRRPTAC
jgi:hypothetical protein